MKKLIVSVIIAACFAFGAVAASDTITVKYDSPARDDLFSSNLLNLQGIDQKKVSVSGNSLSGKEFLLRCHHVVNGRDSVLTTLPFPIRIAGDSLTLCFGTRPVSDDSVVVALNGPFQIITGHKAATKSHVLMETYTSKTPTVVDPVPLIAYTEGIVRKVKFEGQEGISVDYCGLRNARSNPLEWFSKYGIGDFLYYDIIFLPAED